MDDLDIKDLSNKMDLLSKRIDLLETKYNTLFNKENKIDIKTEIYNRVLSKIDIAYLAFHQANIKITVREILDKYPNDYLMNLSENEIDNLVTTIIKENF